MRIAYAVSFCLVFAIVPVASSQSFVFTDFSNPVGLQLNGSAATTAANTLEITGTAGNQAGSAWYTTAQPVLGGFDTVFGFRITPTGQPADGMTFAIHDDPAGPSALGLSGRELGYASLTTLGRSVVVEFDTYANSALGETAPNTVSVHTNGAGTTGAHELYSIGSVAPPFSMADGQVHTARVEYTPGLLNVYIDDLVNPLLSVNFSLALGGTYVSGGYPAPAVPLSGGMATVGFTGGNGGLSQQNEVLNWTWTSAPGLTLAFSQPTGPGSGRIDVTNGTAGDYYLSVFSIDPQNAVSPGSGWWAGLHITLGEVAAAYAFGVSPFVGMLDANGANTFQTPIGLPSGITFYGVTRTLNATQAQVLQNSNIASITLQ